MISSRCKHDRKTGDSVASLSDDITSAWISHYKYSQLSHLSAFFVVRLGLRNQQSHGETTTCTCCVLLCKRNHEDMFLDYNSLNQDQPSNISPLPGCPWLSRSISCILAFHTEFKVEAFRSKAETTPRPSKWCPGAFPRSNIIQKASSKCKSCGNSSQLLNHFYKHSYLSAVSTVMMMGAIASTA